MMKLIDLLMMQGGQYLRDIQPGGLLSQEIPQGMPTQTIKGLLGFTPGVGDAISGYDAIQSARQGDYGAAALNGLGALPFIPSMSGVVKQFPMKMPTAETSPVMAKVLDISSRPKWTKGAAAAKLPDGRFAVTVDGVPVFYEKTLKDAEESARYTDADFWRGEMSNWTK